MADEERLQRIKAGAFLASIAGLSAFVGFGTTLAAAKKADPKYFNKGIHGSVELADAGALLALRALGWGTLYAIGGTSCLCYGIWKLSGAKDFSSVYEMSNKYLRNKFYDTMIHGSIHRQKRVFDLFLCECCISGNMLKDFRIKMGNLLPVLPKNNPPQSRTEFSGMNDLMTYLSEEYGNKKKQDVSDE